MSPPPRTRDASLAEPASKRLKTTDDDALRFVPTGDDAPKSRKQQRLEKKAAKAATVVKEPAPALTKEEKIRLRKQRRKEFLKQEERVREKEFQKERRRKLKAKTAAAVGAAKKSAAAAKQQAVSAKNAERDLEILQSMRNGSKDEATGLTTLERGVQYKDVKVGSGPGVVQTGQVVTVAYQLRAKGSLNVLDSSKNFKFRVGKGEVILGWDIGVVGMLEGGKRHLIVPPKAGYGSQDIGGGAGATLCFDITALHC
jgi:FKBP-type peptidyl-prolyl cis-trans isomerase